MTQHAVFRTFALKVAMVASLVAGVAQFFYHLPHGLNEVVLLLASVVFALSYSKTEQGKDLLSFLADSRKELRRITWPGKQEILQSVWLVMITVVVSMVVFGVLDMLISKVIALSLNLFLL